MTVSQRVIAGVVSLLLTVFVLELVRRRKLREEYSMLWLLSMLAMLCLSISKSALSWLAGVLGIEHAAYAVFVVAIVLGFVLAIHLTVVVSKLTAQNWRLIQEVALLRTELDSLRKAHEAGSGASNG
jgi:hypothetical protein